MSLFYSYWGKSDRLDGSHHLLAYHGLDVAAVFVAYAERHPALTKGWSDALGIEERRLVRWLAYLLALHDAGKFCPRFQALMPQLMQRLQGRVPQRAERGHVTQGALGFQHILRSSLIDRWPAEAPWSRGKWARYLAAWEAPIAGHHGEPPRSQTSEGLTLRVDDHWDEAASAAFLEYAAEVAKLLDVEPPLPLAGVEDAAERVRAASWHLAGLATLCDWLGSNTTWFKFETSAAPLDEYWTRTLQHARQAVDESGILPAEVATGPATMQAMFNPKFRATPMQRLAETMTLDGPALFILEDVTGSGKTEAALILAKRLMVAGSAEGVYFGLPTMATANMMHGRMKSGAAALFKDPAKASLVLAHARAPRGPQEGTTPAAPDDSVLQCAAWIAESRKRALLAHVGVGTIDQALLAVLPVKHQSLRLFGLTRRVLVVDEVHAYDSYTSALLEAVVRFHVSAGGSVILLSATMPRLLRERLVAAAAPGLSATPVNPLTSEEFPLLTRVDRRGVDETRVERAAASSRKVRIEMLATAQEAMGVIRRAHAEGRAVCWIRNSVQDALDAYDSLADLMPVLFHARFTAGDRKRIEDHVVASAGKESTPSQRRGLVVIATQVVEQSLDLDFDEMVTDLAPIVLVLQRAGRLRRHARDAEGARAGTEARGEPVLHVLAPVWANDPEEKWFKEAFPNSAPVYPAHGRLWLTMKTLREEGTLAVPERSRLLVESVYGSDAAERIPERLVKVEDRILAKELALAGMAKVELLDMEAGYARSHHGWDSDTKAKTRDGPPTRDIYLAVAGPVGPTPLSGEEWEDSRVSVRASSIAAGGPGAASILPDKGEWDTLVIMHPDGLGWTGDALHLKGSRVAIRYSEKRGLQVFEEREGENHVQPNR